MAEGRRDSFPEPSRDEKDSSQGKAIVDEGWGCGCSHTASKLRIQQGREDCSQVIMWKVSYYCSHMSDLYALCVKSGDPPWEILLLWQ